MNNLSGIRTMAQASRLVLAGGLVILFVPLSGCFPIPYGPIAYNKIPEESIQAIHSKTSTRADVLLTLADPTVRGEQDGYFVYDWAQGHGGVVLAFVGGYGSGGAAIAVGASSCNSLVIKFTPDGHVDRVKQFLGKSKSATGLGVEVDAPGRNIRCGDPEMQEAIDAWLRENANGK